MAMNGDTGAQGAARQTWAKGTPDAAPPRKTRGWNLSSAAFEQLLAALDVDRERAGAQYRQLHLQLVKFFEWQCSGQADQQADEVIDRLTRRIARGDHIDNLQAYAYGVAKLLLLEARKELEREKRVHTQLLWFAKSRSEGNVESEEALQQQECFDNCLETLTGKNRSIILGYYAGERRSKIEGRRELAAALGTDLNALRVRAYRIRSQLENCVSHCVEHTNDRVVQGVTDSISKLRPSNIHDRTVT
jgi:DNA-directed RNA polymerase specialized sigma24 family protein